MKDQLEVTINGVVYVPKEPEVEQTKDQPYQMRDADWQRVIDEGFDCVFYDRKNSLEIVGKLKGVLFPKPRYQTKNGSVWSHCEVRREVGHRQPHFGGPYPGHLDDLVLVKALGRWHSAIRTAESYFWGASRAAPITEYIVLEKGGEQ
jgi:hypothetical protein